MQAVTTIGLDIAKSVFQVHGVDAEGKVTIRRKQKRRYVAAFFQKLPPCLVGIEACASSHSMRSARILPSSGSSRRSDATGARHCNVVADTSDKRIPEVARACLVALRSQVRILKTQILEFDRLIMAWHRSNEMSGSMRSPASVRCWPPLSSRERRSSEGFQIG